MIYLVIILLADFLIAWVNTCLGFFSFPEALRSAALGTVAVVALDGAGAFLLRRLPEKYFTPETLLLSVSGKERKLYRALGVRSYAKIVPELGMFTGFRKNRLQSTDDPDYLFRFILESRYGALIHAENALCGFFICFFPFCCRPSVWIPIFLVNFILNLLPMMMLRYHLPPLLRLYAGAKRQNERNAVYETV